MKDFSCTFRIELRTGAASRKKGNPTPEYSASTCAAKVRGKDRA